MKLTKISGEQFFDLFHKSAVLETVFGFRPRRFDQSSETLGQALLGTNLQDIHPKTGDCLT